MSASPDPSTPPGADDIADQFALTAAEAQIITDAMTPLQDLTSVGDSVGVAMENLPGSGPPFVGSALQSISMQADLAAQSAETFARAIDFYVSAQGGAMEELFPPPDQIATELERNAEPLRALFSPE